MKEQIINIETNECIYFYAIIDNNIPIGCLEIIPQNNIFLLHKIFVIEKYRNKGIATKLINNFLDYLNNSVYNNIEIKLQVIPDVNNFSEMINLQKKLIKFYKKFGFNIKNKILSEFFNIPIMQKIISK